MTNNPQIQIKNLPKGKLSAGDFAFTSGSIPTIKPGRALVKTTAFAITAGTRAGLQGSASYAGAPETGRVMNGTGVGIVEESKIDGLEPGTKVLCPTGWQTWSLQKASDLTVIAENHNPLDYLGPLGINGLTAWFGLTLVGKPKEGDCVLISAAAGSVGHMAGQIAKALGSRPIGVTGSPEKCELVVQKCGFSACVNYKSPNFRQSLKEVTPQGVDVYFDNTGGLILGSALFRMNTGGRIACCGAVSQYDTNNPEPGPKGIPGLLINKRITMQGFLLFDYAHLYQQARDSLFNLIQNGSLTGLTDQVDGLEAAPEAFVDLLSGGNVGTRLVMLDNG